MAKRIGLLTLPLHANYGGILQAAALHEYLVSQGNEVVLLERESSRSSVRGFRTFAEDSLPIDLIESVSQWYGKHVRAGGWLGTRMRNLARNARLARGKKVHRKFIYDQLPKRTGRLPSTRAMANAVGTFKLDAVIVGSDQVWRVRYQPVDAVEDYFLGFVPDGPVRKISYAASFGVGRWQHPQHTDAARRLLARFDAVSAREASGVEICRTEFGRADAQQVLDPTLLVDPRFYDRIAAPAGQNPTKMLLQYVLDPAPQLASIGQELATIFGEGYSVRTLAPDSAGRPVDIPTWLRAFMDADFVVTDSFHGTVFSILFQKNFLAVVNHDRGSDRFTSLLTMLDLEDRLIDSSDLGRVSELALQPVDFRSAFERLAVWRKKSSEFLERALA